MDYTREAQYARSTSNYDEGLRSYMVTVFTNMSMALGVSGLVAFLISMMPAFQAALFGTPLGLILSLVTLGMVFYISSRIMSMSVEKARSMLIIYSAMMGASLSYVFVVYTGVSILRTFLITASVFGSMALYGYTTKKDLTSMGSFLIMGLIGILIASLVNIFMQSSALAFAISVIGVIVFTGLTAYDIQNLKRTYNQLSGSEEVQKIAIFGALMLYLDFINLFLMMLRFFGDRR